MRSIKVDFKAYSTEQLFEALESVDHYQYPDRALVIYQLILNRLKLDYKETHAETLGYSYEAHNQTVINRILYFLIQYLGSSLGDLVFAERHLLYTQMQEKIEWLNEQMELKAGQVIFDCESTNIEVRN
ncbi:hypothetical protein [Marinicella sp. W31]|uniref:hypothetical protein n=1 Tax=Marinicella sp. W31 TaxID=3023713 RepID=UPI00375680EE